MSYVDKTLQPGEVVKKTAHLHWIIYWLCAFLAIPAILSILTFVIVLSTAGKDDFKNQLINFSPLLFWCILSIGLFFFTWLKQKTTEIVVTNRRVVLKQGVICRRTIEMNLNQVESVDVRQSILGRLLNYGAVIVCGSGGRKEKVKAVADPLTFRTNITLP